MKNTLPSISRYQLAAAGLLLGIGFLVCGSASAQSLLKNGDFEQPLGTTNWTIHYVRGGPESFEIKDRTTTADHHRAQQINTRGLHLRPSECKLAHAYFSQTISNLVAGHTYNVSGWMNWEGGATSGFGNAPTTYRIYFEAIGGLGTARSPDYPDTNGDVFTQYFLTQKPDANGNIEIRLHLDKFGWCNYDKLVMVNGYFDDFSVTY
jgi:hypothetical protein